MENIKKCIIQLKLINKLNKYQIDLFNTLYFDDVNRSNNKNEKEIQLKIDQVIKMKKK